MHTEIGAKLIKFLEENVGKFHDYESDNRPLDKRYDVTSTSNRKK